MERGKLFKAVSVVRRMLVKGMSHEMTADILDTDISVVSRIAGLFGETSAITDEEIVEKLYV